MTRKTQFKQADLTRAIKGAEAAGKRVVRAEIEPSGRIVLVFANGNSDNASNPWDESDWD